MTLPSRWLVVLCGCGRIGFTPMTDGGADASLAASCALVPTPPTTPEYFMSPTGSDAADGSTPLTAWATFAHASTVVGPGATLTLLDGVYRDALASASGAPGAPILIRALHDGAAIIDGENVRYPCDINGADAANHISDIVLEGVHCRNPLDTNAGGETAVLVYHADRVQLRRVTAYGIKAGAFEIADANDVLLEDIAAYGGGTNSITVALSSGVVIRRAYARWTTAPMGTTYAGLLSIADTSGTLVENTVVVGPAASLSLGGFSVASGSLAANDSLFVGDIARGPLDEGFGVAWVAGGSALPMTGTTARDVASIGAGDGVYQRDDAALSVTRATFVAPGTAFGVSPSPGGTASIGFSLTSSALGPGSTGIDVPASPFVTVADHHDNVLDNVATPYANAATAGAGEQLFDPQWDVATYGDGAYLMHPPALATAGPSGSPVGAEILYRSVGGVVTTTPLWPWPLEARILAEDGVGVTWEASGGIWRSPPPVACP